MITKIFKFIKEFPQTIYFTIIAVLGFLFLQSKRKADILKRAEETNKVEKDIAVTKERLKHEEEKSNNAISDYERAKSKYRNSKS